jgi:membrane protease YdiL (CAAX protease family)
MTYLAAVKVASAVVHRVVAGEWPAFGWQDLHLMLAATVGSTLIGGQAGEEIGWRGYALPRLTERFGLAWASLILGVIWASWHLPLFFVPGTTTTGQSFPLYLVQVTALSVAIAWLHTRSNGSLLLVMLMHAAINNTRNIVPAVARDPANPLTPAAPLLGWITAALLWIGAAYFIVRMIRLESSRDRGEEEVRSAKGEGRKKTPSSIRT